MDLEVRLKLKPEISRALAKKSTKALSDETVHTTLKAIMPFMKAGLAGIQKEYHDAAAKDYEKSGAKALFAANFDSINGALESMTATMLNEEVESFLVPSEEEYQLIERMLNTCTILCYRCFALSDTLTEREMLFYITPCARKGTITSADKKSLLPLVRDDVFCMRDATNETKYQNAIFVGLEKYCLAAARRMKSYNARECAIKWLKIQDLLASRNQCYNLCLSTENAKRVITEFKAAHYDLVMVTRYQGL